MYVEGLGWLTSRESAWWESEDGYLHEFNIDGRRVSRSTASSWAPRLYRRNRWWRDQWEECRGPDPRWTPAAIFTIPDLHLGVKCCWRVDGHSKPVRAVPWMDWDG